MRLQDILDMATKAHSGQTRKVSGIPYIRHPLSVYKRLKAFGITDKETLATAIAHDTIEDTPVTHDTLTKTFGKEIADNVQWLSNPKGGNKSEHIKKIMYEAPYQVVLVKIFDRIDNLEDNANLQKYEKDCMMMLQALKDRNFTKLYDHFYKVLNKFYELS